MNSRFCSLAVILTALAILAPSAGAATPHVVNSNADAGDFSGADNVCDVDGPGPGSLCTLRAAIQQANSAPGAPAAPHTIGFALAMQGATVSVGSDLPVITAPGTTIDGCSATPAATQPCAGLRPVTSSGTGLSVGALGVTVRGLAISFFDTGVSVNAAGMILRNSDIGVRVDHTTVEGMTSGVVLTSSGARIGGTSSGEGNFFAGNGDGLLIWGGDATGVYGNRFGLRRSGDVAANDRAIVIAGQGFGGNVVDEAIGNAIGAASNAVSDDGGSCGAACNIIAGSAGDTGAGIDMGGDPANGETPAASTTIAGNWIGLDGTGDAAANEVAIRVGGGGKLVSGDTAGAMIGGPTPAHGNLISGNLKGIDQVGGKGTLNVLSNVFGLGPDLSTAVPNTTSNAELGGDLGAEVYVQFNHFGATGSGLVLTGRRPIVIGNFFTPVAGSYSAAALEIGPGASDALIGTNVGGCIPFPEGCNIFGSVGPGVPAIWIRGADGARVSNNVLGGAPFAAPLAGVPVRISDGPAGQTTSGALIGNDEPSLWNLMVRTFGPAVEIGGGATGAVVAGNEGIATNPGAFSDPASLFTDLLPAPGPGSSGTANGGIQPPLIATSTTAGVSGTGTPGALVRVLQQWRADDLALGIDGPGEGFTLPTSPAATLVAADGSWSMAFAEKLPLGQKVTASQTTDSGSSEYAALRTTSAAPDLPIAQITGGPAGTIAERSATFTFSSPTPGAALECSLDGAAFAACSSPRTVGPLEPGAHQFRVQARVADLVSLPAARTWSIELPATTPPPAPARTANASQRFSRLVTLPSARRCVSRRRLRLRLHAPSGARIVYAEVRVSGRPLRTVSGSALRSAIDLRGLPRGKVRVRVRVVLSSGRVVNGSRTYRTCAVKKRR